MNNFRSKNQIVVLLFIILLGINPKLFAQNTEDSIYRFNGKYLVSYWHDTKYIVTEPIRWKGQQWATFAGIATAWTVTFAMDEDIYEFFKATAQVPPIKPVNGWNPLEAAIILFRYWPEFMF